SSKATSVRTTATVSPARSAAAATRAGSTFSRFMVTPLHGPLAQCRRYARRGVFARRAERAPCGAAAGASGRRRSAGRLGTRRLGTCGGLREVCRAYGTSEVVRPREGVWLHRER